jgi:dUTP pyrophosphatase
MFISGDEMREFLQPLKGEQVQPAGIDLTISEVFELDGGGEIDFSNEHRKVPAGKKIEFGEKVKLGQGSYRITYGEAVRMPKDAAGIVLPRSTLMRMGATVISALWDPGYEGRGYGLLVVFNPHGIVLHRNARVAQIMMVRGRTEKEYEGAYKGENL